jgi:hypothetical protein
MFTSFELAQRLEAIAAVAPDMPEVHFLLAKHSANVDVRKGLYFAVEAAKVANRARAKPHREVQEATLEWRCWHLAAVCAQQMKHEDQALELMQRAIAAGAPKELLQVRDEKSASG